MHRLSQIQLWTIIIHTRKHIFFLFQNLNDSSTLLKNDVVWITINVSAVYPIKTHTLITKFKQLTTGSINTATCAAHGSAPGHGCSQSPLSSPLVRNNSSDWSDYQPPGFPLVRCSTFPLFHWLAVCARTLLLCAAVWAAAGVLQSGRRDTAEEKTGLEGLKAGWKTEGDPSGRGGNRGEPEGGTAPTKLLGTRDERGGSGEGYLIPEPPVRSVWRRSCGKVNSVGENSCRLSNTRSHRRGP